MGCSGPRVDLTVRVSKCLNMTLNDWPSLAPQRALSARFPGAGGAASLERWLQTQLARVDDHDFARLFSDHITLSGVVQADFNHRYVRMRAGRFLGGIRFHGGDVTRPFVEIVAHDVAEIAALRDAVTQEWALFSPRALRLLLPPGLRPVGDAWLDMSIHAAPYAKMRRPDDLVRLTPFACVEEAVAMVDARYHDLTRAAPALRRNLSPASARELADCHATGGLRAIHADGAMTLRPVGLLAVRDGAVEWIEGDEIAEEIVTTAAAGRGVAARAQMVWAAAQQCNRDRLLIGTIDGLNPASRRSAENAGRPAVLDYVFVPLHPSPRSDDPGPLRPLTARLPPRQAQTQRRAGSAG